MNPIEYDIKRQRNIELLVLIIGSFYMLAFSVLITVNHWDNLYLVTIVVFMVLAWMFYLLSYKDYRFRAYLTFGMLQLSLVLYTLKLETIVETFATMISLTVIILLYSIPELIIITLIAYTFEILYHALIARSIYFVGGLEDCRNIFLILAVYFVQFVIYYALYRQSEISQLKDERIEELKEAERSKDDFLANVSHEIRTPINTICGMSETVLREEISGKVREDIFSIQTAGQNLLSVVSDILDFSEMQAENVELVEEVYNVGYLVNDVINMSISKKNEKKIELIVDMDAGMPLELVGDEQKLRRVIINLVNNAIKFTNEGCVSVGFSYRKEDYGVNLTVTVKDTGIGMKQDRMEKIFSMFSQIDSKRNRQEGGIGLGLAISKAIITQMGGFISAQSEYDRGTTVQFTIPQKVANPEPVAVVENPALINIAVYINMDQFAMSAIRDAYSNTIQNMVDQLNVPCHVCQNLPELKRKIQREYVTHVFISLLEYQEDPAFFDSIEEPSKVMIILDHHDERLVANDKLIRIFKPFSVLSVVRALNGETTVGYNGMNQTFGDGFRAPSAHILAVDDNLMNLKVLENLLKPYEIQLVTVTSGQEALDRIASKDYDMVFMDHMMPEMDGIETLKRIRNKPGQYYKRLPIVALTANAVSGMREMFLAEGFDGFVSKPIELSALERILHRFIPETKILPKEKEPVVSQQVTMEAVAQSPTPSKSKENDMLQLQDLDIEKGMTYCGGMDGYIDVLKLHLSDGKKNQETIQELYEAQNWSEYAIYVHALKSSMMSIGAVPLSEMAKKLEFAAKNGAYQDIFASHDDTMKEYQRVLAILGASPALQSGQPEESDSEHLEVSAVHPAEAGAVPEQKVEHAAKELPDEEFEQFIVRLEDAVYALDKDTMVQIVDNLYGYQYHGHTFDSVLDRVRRKLDMEDYMSAYDVMLRMKEKWSKD